MRTFVIIAVGLIAGASAACAPITETRVGASVTDSATENSLEAPTRVQTEQGTNSVLPGKDPFNSKAYIQDH